ncbi:hypothetical protein FO519_008790 [Halicephalobus sp. NKZ332]|nr:hypothetical protein FO519_008790 [Halicephalobus sp. NKZ332]
MTEEEFMNVSLAEVITKPADELLAKACINEKGQKILIKRLATTQKDEIVEECSEEAALKAITSKTFCSSPEGRRLARHLILKFGIEKSWQSILQCVRTKNPSKHHCNFIGQIWMNMWKKLERQAEEENLDPESADRAQDAEEKRNVLERTIMFQIFEYAIITDRKFAEKFIHMIDGIVEDKNASAGHMITMIVAELLWKSLDAPNMICRLNAANVFLRLFPLSPPDEDLGYDIREKEHDVFLSLLKDDCYQIRIDTIKTVLKTLAISWIGIKNNFRKEYLSLIIDELSKDDCPDVRLAVYTSFPLLYSTRSAHQVVIHALKILGPRGLNDPKEKNRLAAVKMLLLGEGKLPEHVHEIVDYQELLACLDVEVDSEVEDALVKILLPKVLVDLRQNSNVTQFIKQVGSFCESSRNGALKFFCRISLKKMISNDEAAMFICAIVVGALSIMKELDKEGDETTVSLNETLVNRGVDFARTKTLLDCAVVLFAGFAPILGAEKDASNFTKSVKAISKMVVKILEGRYKSTILSESALTAASFIPLVRIDQNLVQAVKKGVFNLPLDDPTFPQYVQTFVMWNMDEFVKTIERGLYEIAKELNLNHLVPKKKERSEFEKNTKKAIVFLNIALDHTPANELLLKKFGLQISKFQKFLTEFINVIPKFKEGTEEEDFWTRTYELHTVLSVICASEISVGNPDFVNESNKENDEDIDLDPFEKEYQWFDSRFARDMFTPKFISKFISCMTIHFESNQQKTSSCELIVKLAKDLLDYAGKMEQSQELRKLIVDLKKAALEAVPFAKVVSKK